MTHKLPGGPNDKCTRCRNEPMNPHTNTPEDFPACVDVIFAAGGLAPTRELARDAVRTVVGCGCCKLNPG